jgi:hypothetical protein
MIRRGRGPLTGEEIARWEAFLAAYTASSTRQVVDMFLRGLFGRRDG